MGQYSSGPVVPFHLPTFAPFHLCTSAPSHLSTAPLFEPGSHFNSGSSSLVPRTSYLVPFRGSPFKATPPHSSFVTRNSQFTSHLCTFPPLHLSNLRTLSNCRFLQSRLPSGAISGIVLFCSLSGSPCRHIFSNAGQGHPEAEVIASGTRMYGKKKNSC